VILFRRVLGFAMLPVISALSALVLLPMVTRYQGAAGWSSLALGQSLGAVISVIGGLAWPFIGGDRIARDSDKSNHSYIFMLAVCTRGLVTLAGLIIGTVFLIFLSPGPLVATWLFMAGVAGNALTAAWFYAGTGSPSRLIVNEGIPRLLGYLASVPLLAITHDIFYYALMTFLAQLLTLALNYCSAIGLTRPPRVSMREVSEELRGQAGGTLARVFIAIGRSGGPPIVAAINPDTLAIYSAMDSIYKAGYNATNFVPLGFVQWIGQAEDRRTKHRRIRIGVGLIAIVCVVGGVIWQIVGNLIVEFLYAGQLDANPTRILLIGLAVFVLLFNFAIEMMVLVPLGLSDFMFKCQLAASAIGLALFPILGRFGAESVFIISIVVPGITLTCYTIKIYLGTRGESVY